jgi:hypothetical protein
LRNDDVELVTKMECYSDRLMFVKSAKPVDIVTVQMYMLTSDHDNDMI